MYRVLHIDNDLDHHKLIVAQIGKIVGDFSFTLVPSMQETVKAMEEENFDCILTDEEMISKHGIDLFTEMRKQGSCFPVVVLADFIDDEDAEYKKSVLFEDEFSVLVNTFRFDAICYWLKHLSDRHKQMLNSGEMMQNACGISPERLEEIRELSKDLTKREKEILNCISEGKTNQEIADELFISYRTVKNHIYNIFTKLGIHSRAETIQIAISLKLHNTS